MGSASSKATGQPSTTDLDDDHHTARRVKHEDPHPTGIHAKAAAVDITKYDYPFANLALEGGGNKGLAYAGALRVMEEIGISVESGKIKRIVGTSSGGMTAALIAIGYNSYDIEGFLSQDIEDIFLDSRFGFLSLIPNILSDYGWNPGKKILEWFGEKVKAKLGEEDATFRQLYDSKGVELCVVATNLNQMSVDYCHPKTTPDMPIRVAVRMSMSIPVMFAPLTYVNYGKSDMYVDGGVICNFPIHAYDGWWLSMKKEDGFFKRISAMSDLNCLMQNNVRFGKYNQQTMGFMLYADDEEDLFRAKMQSRYGTTLHIDEIPDTVMGKKFKKVAEDERTHMGNYRRLMTAVNAFMGEMSKHDKNGDETISFNEFKAVLSDEQFTEYDKVLLFGENYNPSELFNDISKGDGSISFKDVLNFLESRGLDIQSKLLGYKRRAIGSLSEYINSIQSTMSINVGRIYMQIADVKRTVGINTGHVGTTDFDLEPDDRKFLVERGRRSAVAFLKYFVVWNELKPK